MYRFVRLGQVKKYNTIYAFGRMVNPVYVGEGPVCTGCTVPTNVIVGWLYFKRGQNNKVRLTFLTIMFLGLIL